jgi:hypothetical protein
VIFSGFAWLILVSGALADEAKGVVKTTKGSFASGKPVVTEIVLTIDKKEIEFSVDKKTKIFDGKTEVKDPAARDKFLNTDLLLAEVVITYKKGEKKNVATEVKVIKK